MTNQFLTRPKKNKRLIGRQNLNFVEPGRHSTNPQLKTKELYNNTKLKSSTLGREMHEKIQTKMYFWTILFTFHVLIWGIERLATLSTPLLRAHVRAHALSSLSLSPSLSVQTKYNTCQLHVVGYGLGVTLGSRLEALGLLLVGGWRLMVDGCGYGFGYRLSAGGSPTTSSGKILGTIGNLVNVKQT